MNQSVWNSDGMILTGENQNTERCMYCLFLCIVYFYVLFILYCSMYCLCVNVYCHRVTTQLQLTNISYHKICPSATTSNKNRTKTDLESNPGFRGDVQATGRLSNSKTSGSRERQVFFSFAQRTGQLWGSSIYRQAARTRTNRVQSSRIQSDSLTNLQTRPHSCIVVQAYGNCV